MPTINSLSLTDGTTPITLAPTSHVAGETRYRAVGASIQGANRSAVFLYKDQGKAQRQVFRFTDPIVVTDTTTGEEIVRENNLVEVNTRISSLCTPAQRESCIRYAFSAALTAALKTELETGEGQW